MSQFDDEIMIEVYKEFPVQHNEHLCCKAKRDRIDNMRKQYATYLRKKHLREQQKRLYSGCEKGKREVHE